MEHWANARAEDELGGDHNNKHGRCMVSDLGKELMRLHPSWGRVIMPVMRMVMRM